MACSLMIGGLTSQSNNIRDERDHPLQIVGGDRPNNYNPNTHFAYAESTAAD